MENMQLGSQLKRTENPASSAASVSRCCCSSLLSQEQSTGKRAVAVEIIVSCQLEKDMTTYGPYDRILSPAGLALHPPHCFDGGNTVMLSCFHRQKRTVLIESSSCSLEASTYQQIWDNTINNSRKNGMGLCNCLMTAIRYALPCAAPQAEPLLYGWHDFFLPLPGNGILTNDVWSRCIERIPVCFGSLNLNKMPSFGCISQKWNGHYSPPQLEASWLKLSRTSRTSLPLLLLHFEVWPETFNHHSARHHCLVFWLHEG